MINVGIIDSGLGGLSVVKETIKLKTNCNINYLYDNKYHPYGGKSREELCAITFKNIETLIALGADIIVLACNTITSACADEMRHIFSLPIIGTEPPVKPALTECSKIAIMATPYTIRGAKLKRLLAMEYGKSIIYPDCSGLASAIEYSYGNNEYLGEYIDKIVPFMRGVDGVAIGCTHYYYIMDLLLERMPNVKVYEPSSGVARNLLRHINQKGNMSIKIIITGENVSISQITKFIKC